MTEQVIDDIGCEIKSTVRSKIVAENLLSVYLAYLYTIRRFLRLFPLDACIRASYNQRNLAGDS